MIFSHDDQDASRIIIMMKAQGSFNISSVVAVWCCL